MPNYIKEEFIMNERIFPFKPGIDPSILPGGVNETLKTIDDTPEVKPSSGYGYSTTMYEYISRLERINLDQECRKDLKTNRGFEITAEQSLKKETKSDAGIFSSKYGPGMGDDSPYQDRYRCDCGYLKGKIEDKIICPKCKTPVHYVGDDMEYFGWIILHNPDHVYIHPNLYSSIKYLMGSDKLDRILRPSEEKDQDGNVIEVQYANKEESFFGIGMLGFHKRFDEIIEYYASKNKNKLSYYEDILENKSKVFAHCLPVFTVKLRPYQIKEGRFIFEGANSEYRLLTKFAANLNEGSAIDSKERTVNDYLYAFQQNVNKLTEDINKILSGKKGTIRGLFGGRFNFISRCVIVPDPSLKVDEIGLPYMCLMETLQQSIINIIQRTYNMTYLNAYMRWWQGLLKVDPIMVGIIESIIAKQDNGRGIPYLINRNPTIKYGGIMQMYCVKINTASYAMAIPLQILKPLAADFDGDVLNICRIINKEFLMHAEQVFNPRNAMFISRNTGKVDIDILPSRDTVQLSDTIMYMGREGYTPEEVAEIEALINKRMA